MQQRPGDELVFGPGVVVGPEEELVGHPGEEAEGGVVQGEAQGTGFGPLDSAVGGLGGEEPGAAGEAGLLEGGGGGGVFGGRGGDDLVGLGSGFWVVVCMYVCICRG